MHHPIYTCFLANKYTATYLKLVSQSSRTLTGYIERHHIVPQALGGDDSPANLVELTPREHFICHLLLLKMTAGADKAKMAFAANMMGVQHRGQQRYPVTGRLYDIVKREFSKVRGELNTALWQDEQFRAKMAKKWTNERRAWYKQMGRDRLADPKVRAEYKARTDKLWADPEYRNRCASASKAARNTPESKAKSRAAAIKMGTDPAYRAKLAAASKAKWQDPEYRAKVTAACAAGQLKRLDALAKEKAAFQQPLLTF